MITRRSIKELITFAFPIVAGQMGQMMFGVGDIMVAGRYSNDVLAALGTATGIMAPFLMVGLGVSYAIGPIVAKYRGEDVDKPEAVFTAQALGAIVSIFLYGLLLLLTMNLDIFGLNPAIEPLVAKYLRVAGISILPMLLFQVYKEYLQAFDRTVYSNGLVLAFNVVNVVLNTVMMFGLFGVPEMGIDGAAWATVISRTLMAIVLFVHTNKFRSFSNKVDKDLLSEFLKLGLPIGFSTLLEVLSFSTVTVLIGGMDVITSASHNVVLNLASLSFMIPLGVSSAVSVKVGQAFGAKNQKGIMTWSYSALATVGTIMFFTAAMYTLIPGVLLAFFTDDANVISFSAKMLVFVALFQIPDGLQVTLYGILRGIGITRLPMLFAFISNWMIGIPAGHWLATSGGMGASGYWAGLAIGLSVMCLFLGTLFFKRIKG
ncbi:MAG: hypothetical protein CME71_06350 [Halobacteriovorax sp.]|nr:hypothetical protein [Halobacteriovorax sp.]